MECQEVSEAMIIWDSGKQLNLGDELSGGRQEQSRKRAHLPEIQHDPSASTLWDRSSQNTGPFLPKEA